MEEEEKAAENFDAAEEGAELSEEKMLTQSQVNEIVGQARREGRESAMRELWERYGVSGDDELDEVFGNGQRYCDLDDEFRVQGDSLRAMQAENALLKTKVDEARWGDIKLILGGKGLEITPENIEAEIPSHPEWRRAEPREAEAAAEPTVLRKLGGEAKSVEDDSESEQDRAMKMFGLK